MDITPTMTSEELYEYFTVGIGVEIAHMGLDDTPFTRLKILKTVVDEVSFIIEDVLRSSSLPREEKVICAEFGLVFCNVSEKVFLDLQAAAAQHLRRELNLD